MQHCSYLECPLFNVLIHTCHLLVPLDKIWKNLFNYYFNCTDGIKNIAEGTSQLHNETTKMPQRCKLKDGRCARWPVFIDKGHKQGRRKVLKSEGASSNSSTFNQTRFKEKREMFCIYICNPIKIWQDPCPPAPRSDDPCKTLKLPKIYQNLSLGF